MTTKGVFTGTRGSGAISRGTTGGADIAYDAAGERVTATTSVSGYYLNESCIGTYYENPHTEFYSEDGYLVAVKIGEGSYDGTTVIAPTTGVLRATEVRDAMGRVRASTPSTRATGPRWPTAGR